MTSATAPRSLGKDLGGPRRCEKRTRRVVEEIDTLDRAIHDAVASTPTPTLDKPLAQISHAANYSRLWLVIAAALAVVGGHRGRQAAMRGLTAVGASSVTANLVAKQVVPRSRPEQIPFTVRSQSRAADVELVPVGPYRIRLCVCDCSDS